MTTNRRPESSEARRLERLFDSAPQPEAARGAVARVILNLDEFLHRK